jgi:hypothetical protein
MAKLKVKNKEISTSEYLKKLQDIQKKSSRQRLSTKLKSSSAATE